LPAAIEASRIRALLLDIEGTTTPVDFVFKTLFPFAGEHVEEYLRKKAQDQEIKTIVAELRGAYARDVSNEKDIEPWDSSAPERECVSAAAYVRWLIGRDSKITPLKSLQGKIWEQGYHLGELKGEVYADVAPAFVRWHDQGRRIAIFSSGSVLAQQLLFSHSTVGDLSPQIEAYFDTTTGPKREPESYRKIAAALKLSPAEILFLSDAVAELDAAHSAGLATALSLRPGVNAPERHAHPVFQTFDEILES
jgi:enolase-phosphatase E1